MAATILSLAVGACGTGGELGPSAPTATIVTPSVDTIRFPGTRVQSFQVDADGSWTVSSGASWLSVSPRSGSGSRAVTIAVDRTGLTPDDYAATVRLRGDGVEASVRVAMRFPRLTGRVDYPPESTFLAFEDADVDISGLSAGEDYVDGDVVVRLDPVEVALLGRADGALRLAADPVKYGEIETLGRLVATDHGLAFRDVLAEGDPVVRFSTDRPMTDVVQELVSDPRVVSADPNYRLDLAWVPNDPLFSEQWHFELINLPEAWDVERGREDVTVAIIDSGFTIGHEDLVGQWAAGGYDFANDVSDADAGDTVCAGHGTHVAGTIGAATDNGIGVAGVAPGARMLPLRIGSYNPADDTCEIELVYLVRALQYIAGYNVPGSGRLERLPDVVNVSLGGPTRLTVIEPLLAEIAGNGAVTVAASGNDGEEGILYPARYDTTIAVGAVKPDAFLAEYSNTGPELDLVAPGGAATNACDFDNVISTVRPSASCGNALGAGYGTSAGTSMAAPHVAGVAALLISQHPDLGLEQVRAILTRTADGGGVRSDRYGYGMILADQALDYVEDGRYEITTVDLVGPGGSTVTKAVSPVGSFAFEDLIAGIFDLHVYEGVTRVAEHEVAVDYDGDVEVAVNVTD